MTELRVQKSRDGTLELVIEGRLDSADTGKLWRKATNLVRGARTVILDAARVEYCDGP